MTVCMYRDIHTLQPYIRGEWSASHDGHFTPLERAPSIHLTGASLHVLVKK